MDKEKIIDFPNKETITKEDIEGLKNALGDVLGENADFNMMDSISAMLVMPEEQFRLLAPGILQSYKQSLNNIMQAEYEMLEPIWEEISRIEPKIKARAEELTKKLYPIKDEVKRIVDMLNSVNKWEMNKLFDIVEIVDRFDEKKLDLLKNLIEYQQSTNR